MFSNFRQYGLPPPELLRSGESACDMRALQPLYNAPTAVSSRPLSDNSLYMMAISARSSTTPSSATPFPLTDVLPCPTGHTDNALYDGHFRTQPLYHAIVCDPPYGIRAGARRTGSRRAVVKEITPEQRATHIPMTRPYPVVSYGFKSDSRG